MPSIARAILLALHASSFLALTDLAPAIIHALASPIPDPFLVAPPNSPSSLMAVRVLGKHNNAQRPPPIARASSASLHQRASTSDLVNRFRSYSEAAQTDSANMKKLAAESAYARSDDLEFQGRCTTVLTSYQTNIVGVQDILAELGADKGLANFDRTDDIEVYLKAIVNVNKDILSCVSILVDNLPVLGPILGPIVYQIKCLLDDVLNIVENLTDALINICAPLLKALLAPFSGLLCALGLGLGLVDCIL
ncbi:hypothetical protein B0H10DRAFT_2224603 [Mycena sp. CBHHK59/15]|nr:hypothetical protein B0H10DRAFT_2224603 [Mycena sp. CBHHK59/15]